MTENNQESSVFKNYIERIERLEQELKDVRSDIAQVYSEAEKTGYDKKAMKEIVKIRKMNKMELEEKESLIDEYKSLLNM